VTIPESIWIDRTELRYLSEDGTLEVIANTTASARGNELEYVLNSNPPVDAYPIRKCGFTGGREDTPFAEIVPCSYYRAEPGEVSIEITGRCSVATLSNILHWFKRNTIEKTNAGGEKYRIFAGDE
jgi:hypothetical protein